MIFHDVGGEKEMITHSVSSKYVSLGKEMSSLFPFQVEVWLANNANCFVKFLKVSKKESVTS